MTSSILNATIIQTPPSHETLYTMINVVDCVEEYLKKNDWRVQANANQGYSLGGLILNVSGKVIANYWLNHIYPPEIGQAHRQGDFHIHDLDMLSGYCAGWSLRTLLTEGFNGIADKIEANPPKHLSSAIGQMVNFLGTLQNEWAGAQAFSSFDTYLAPFVRKDHLTYSQVKQCIQEFIYNLNVPSRWGSQSPFTNITFDWVCPADLQMQVPMIAGEEMPFTYGELSVEMEMINRAYLEVMSSGDAKDRIFTFPIPTYNITPDFPWESPNVNLLFAVTAKFGLPYFQNFINSDLKPEMVRSMCCRLQLDLRELQKRGNGLFGSAEQTGSVGVVTMNCARLGYLFAGNEVGLYQRLDELLTLGKESLEIKRQVIQQHIDNGLFPFTKRYLGTLRNHFSTLGVNGINELIRNFTNDAHNITTDWGKQFAIQLLNHIRSKMVEFQKSTGHLYNLEATPAEGTTYRFAKEDKKRFPKILQAGTAQCPYYTNSSQLPVGFTDDPFLAMNLQNELQKCYTGGTVLHFYMNEQISSLTACKNLVRRILERSNLPYITITPNHLAVTLFCQGCTWRCHYCHNPHLLPMASDGGHYPWAEIEIFLQSRQQLLDAVVFSGGEPTLQKGLLQGVQRVRQLGFKVGLHTAGINPHHLKKVLPYLDWVGFDIKASFAADYDKITGKKNSGYYAQKSLRLLLDSGVDYELRTASPYSFFSVDMFIQDTCKKS